MVDTEIHNLACVLASQSRHTEASLSLCHLILIKLAFNNPHYTAGESNLQLYFNKHRLILCLTRTKNKMEKKDVFFFHCTVSVAFSCCEMLHRIFHCLISMIKYEHVIARSPFPDMNSIFLDEV